MLSGIGPKVRRRILAYSEGPIVLNFTEATYVKGLYTYFKVTLTQKKTLI